VADTNPTKMSETMSDLYESVWGEPPPLEVEPSQFPGSPSAPRFQRAPMELSVADHHPAPAGNGAAPVPSAGRSESLEGVYHAIWGLSTAVENLRSEQKTATDEMGARVLHSLMEGLAQIENRVNERIVSLWSRLADEVRNLGQEVSRAPDADLREGFSAMAIFLGQEFKTMTAGTREVLEAERAQLLFRLDSLDAQIQARDAISQSLLRAVRRIQLNGADEKASH
jgi:hypothetical protein